MPWSVDPDREAVLVLVLGLNFGQCREQVPKTGEIRGSERRLIVASL